MTGCCGNVWDLLTSVNNPEHCIRMAYVDHPDVLCKPSGWYVYKCRLIFLEVVQKNVSCVLCRKIWMRVTQMTISVMCHCKMRATCHCKMRATCSRMEGSLHSWHPHRSKVDWEDLKISSFQGMLIGDYYYYYFLFVFCLGLDCWLFLGFFRQSLLWIVGVKLWNFWFAIGTTDKLSPSIFHSEFLQFVPFIF